MQLYIYIFHEFILIEVSIATLNNIHIYEQHTEKNQHNTKTGDGWLVGGGLALWPPDAQTSTTVGRHPEQHSNNAVIVVRDRTQNASHTKVVLNRNTNFELPK